MLNDFRILIVEDDASLRDVLRQYLSIYYEVSLASNLATARQAIAQSPCDLVLLDKHLPDGTGLSLLAELRSLRPSPAVIILTSDGEFNAITKALAQGADDYLVKNENLIPHLLVRIPVVVKHAEQRNLLNEISDRPNVQIPKVSRDFTPASYRACLEQVEKEYLQAALRTFDGNIQLTAERLEVSRSTLFRKISEYGIGKRSRDADSQENQITKQSAP